jgi:c(7)-type cytochrome triheme protein
VSKALRTSLKPVRLAYPIVTLGLTLAILLTAQAAETPRDGKQVYDSACAACHTPGLLQAPKLGSNDEWVEREKQGFEVLIEHAIKGVRNMPAKGGNPTIKDGEIENAIRYMLASSGFDQYAPAPAAADEAAKQTSTAAASEPKTVKPVQTSSANQFNRLMKSASEWNPPPAEDGIHDPDSAGTLLLQPPRIAFESLAKSKSGNRVDWVKSLQNNEITPRYERLDDQARPVVMDLNIVREVKGSMPDVVYSHKQHTEWLDCSNCHPAIFIPQKGANQISMASILLGQKCGVCHGKVAFPVSECRKCHSKQKPATSGAKTSARN